MTAQLEKRGGETYLTTVMPCGPLDGPVTITGTTMRLTGQQALGADGCIESAGEQRTWILELMQGSVELAYADGILTWTRGQDSISFSTS
ncbi:hypothetical protein [Paenarthrobacter sp. 4246]|uniref:hypothetical protein n=1 Tax=Paenarthrobacter sp. 4246 TaxID=3156456 RepID=UPI0033908437